MLTVVADDDAHGDDAALDGICRKGARLISAAALEAERDAYLAAFADERRRGRLPPTSSTTLDDFSQ
jgi:hypothetical protein